MAKDTGNTEEKTENEVIVVKSRVRNWWDNNKSKLAWFGLGAITGAGTVVATALLMDPIDEFEGNNEETVEIDVNSGETTAS